MLHVHSTRNEGSYFCVRVRSDQPQLKDQMSELRDGDGIILAERAAKKKGYEIENQSETIVWVDADGEVVTKRKALETATPVKLYRFKQNADDLELNLASDDEKPTRKSAKSAGKLRKSSSAK